MDLYAVVFGLGGGVCEGRMSTAILIHNDGTRSYVIA